MADKNFLTDIIDADLARARSARSIPLPARAPTAYLHIGSAKAIYINWSIANQYGGKFNLRLDDTNPAREGEEYVNSIIEDLHWLGADPNGGIFYGSDYFDQCYEYAEKLISGFKEQRRDLLMGHVYRVGVSTFRFGKEKLCQPPIQSLEHDLLHRPHHIRKAFPFRVRSRMTRTEVVSVCVPYQWQLCLPQPWSPQE